MAKATQKAMISKLQRAASQVSSLSRELDDWDHDLLSDAGLVTAIDLTDAAAKLLSIAAGALDDAA